MTVGPGANQGTRPRLRTAKGALGEIPWRLAAMSGSAVLLVTLLVVGVIITKPSRNSTPSSAESNGTSLQHQGPTPSGRAASADRTAVSNGLDDGEPSRGNPLSPGEDEMQVEDWAWAAAPGLVPLRQRPFQTEEETMRSSHPPPGLIRLFGTEELRPGTTVRIRGVFRPTSPIALIQRGVRSIRMGFRASEGAEFLVEGTFTTIELNPSQSTYVHEATVRVPQDAFMRRVYFSVQFPDLGLRSDGVTASVEVNSSGIPADPQDPYSPPGPADVTATSGPATLYYYDPETDTYERWVSTGGHSVLEGRITREEYERMQQGHQP